MLDSDHGESLREVRNIPDRNGERWHRGLDVLGLVLKLVGIFNIPV